MNRTYGDSFFPERNQEEKEDKEGERKSDLSWTNGKTSSANCPEKSRMPQFGKIPKRSSSAFLENVRAAGMERESATPVLAKDVGVYAPHWLYCFRWEPRTFSWNDQSSPLRGGLVLLYSRISITALCNSLSLSALSFFTKSRGGRGGKGDRENDRDPRCKGKAISRPRLSCSFPADIKDRSAWYVRLFSGSHNFHVFTSTVDRCLRL